MMHKSIIVTLASVAAMALCACHSAPTRIHALEAAPAVTRVDSYRAPPLRVDSVHVPVAWDRVEILSPATAGELKIDDFDHWSAPLAQLVRQVLSADLDARLPADIVVFPHLSKPPGALGIDVDILEFTVASSQGWMSVSWSIAPAIGSASVRRDAAMLHAPLANSDPAAVAHAWSVLLGQLADRLAADAALFSAP